MQQVAGAIRWARQGHASALAPFLQALLAGERGRPALWLPVFLGAGDLAYFALRSEPRWWIGAALLAPTLAACWLARPWPAVRAGTAALAAAALGFAAAQFAALRAPGLAALPSRATIISATVLGVEPLPQGRRVLLGAARLDDQAPLDRSLRIRLRRDDGAAIAAGDALRLRALVRPPPPPAYPGGWDLQRDAYFAGFAGYGYALGPAEVTPAAGGGWSSRLHALREGVAGRITAALPDARGAIAATLLTGLSTGIAEADRAAFRDSGLAHLLAIAGLHIGIVMGLVMGVSRLLLAAWEWAALHWPIKQVAALAALAAGGGYALLTGVHVPILRSFAMAALVTLGLLAGRRAISLRGLAVAAAVLLLTSPEQVTGVSFQMSFSAVLALIAGYQAMQPHLRALLGEAALPGRLLTLAATLAMTSLLAGTASAPFAAYHFDRIQLYYVVANLFAVPLTAFWVMPAGLAALALMPLGLERLALLPMGWGVGAVLWIGRTVSAWPAATVAVPQAPGWGLALVALGLAWLGLWRLPWRAAGLPLIALGLLSPWLVRRPDLLVSADARVIALRTQQGVFAQIGPGASRFTQDSFERFWARGRLRDLHEAGPDLLGCEAAGCLLRPAPGAPAALLLLGEGQSERCAEAALIVSAEPIRQGCPGDLPRIDRFTVWRDGAQAVWLGPGGATILSDRAERGQRPWVQPTPVRQPTRAPLPMAPAAPLPPE